MIIHSILLVIRSMVIIFFCIMVVQWKIYWTVYLYFAEALSSIPYKVSVRERVAQLVVLSTVVGDVELVTEIGKTDRGSSGFGSTGL
jgi:hypothetical protein